VHITQSHADAAVGLSYALLPPLSIDGGYRFTYFLQHEKSKEDDNFITLYDSGIVLGLTYRF
jgi:opacity protein-like surface antigen